MSEKTTLESITGYWKKAWNATEEFINDVIGTDIDYFTDPQTVEERNWVTADTEVQVQEVRTNIDYQKSEVLLKVKTGITELFNKLKWKLPDKEIEGWDHDWKTYIEVLQEKYDSIMLQLEWCSNDDDLKEIYKTIQSEITSWIAELSVKEAWLMESLYSLTSWLEVIKKETITWLEDLKLELTRFEWEDVAEKAKKELLAKRKKEEDSWMKSLLIKIWLSAWLAWTLSWLFAMLWFKLGSDTKETWFFNSVIGIISNPVEWLKKLFWRGSGEENEEDSEESEEEVIVKWKIKPSWDFVTYTNTNIEIQTEKKKIKYIKLHWKDYKFNLEISDEIKIEPRGNIDYIIIWDKEINLLTFIAKLKEVKDEYVLKQNFLNWEVLKLIKI